jgi:hypothetical protein
VWRGGRARRKDLANDARVARIAGGDGQLLGDPPGLLMTLGGAIGRIGRAIAGLDQGEEPGRARQRLG